MPASLCFILYQDADLYNCVNPGITDVSCADCDRIGTLTKARPTSLDSRSRMSSSVSTVRLSLARQQPSQTQ